MELSLTQSNQNENLLFRVSVAESLLNEYYKEESLYKGINIFKEILESEVEKNSKNILNIILSKLIDIYLKSSNRTKCLINNIIFCYRNKFSTIFINKDISDKLIAIVTCSDCLARSYTLQLISYLPSILEKRLDLLHMIYDLYISNKSLLEEKLAILNLFEMIMKKGSNDNLQTLLVENFEKMMNILSCKKCDFINICRKCQQIKIKVLKIFRNIEITYTRGKIVCYLEKNYKNENFRISSILLSLLQKENYFNNLVLKFLQGLDDEFKLIFLEYFEISKVIDEKFLFALLREQSIQTIRNFIHENLDNCRRFTFTIILSLLDDQISINKTFNNITSLGQITKILFVIPKIYTLNSENSVQTVNVINHLSQKNLKQFFNTLITHVSKNNIKLNIDNFFNSKNIENFIDLINKFKSYNELNPFYHILLNIFVKIFQNSLQEFESCEENLRYIYFLDKLMDNLKFDKKEIFLLFSEPIFSLSPRKELVGKCFKKLANKYNIDIDLTCLNDIAKEKKDEDIITEYKNLKEAVFKNDIEKTATYFNIIKNSELLSNTTKKYLEKFNHIFFYISKLISNLKIDITEIDNLFNLQINDHIKYLEIERNSPLTQFSKDVILNQFNFIKSLIIIKSYLNQKNYNKIFDELDNFMNTSVLLLLSMENKLDTFIDIKTKCLNSSTVSQFSDYIEKEINNLLSHYTRFILIINPIFDIQISTQLTKSIQADNIFLVQSRLLIINPWVYLKNINNILLTVYLNFMPVKEIELKVSKQNYLISDMIIPYTKKKKNQLEEFTLSYSLSFIHEEFYKFTFYDYRVQQNI
jgi:hypothetical protein